MPAEDTCPMTRQQLMRELAKLADRMGKDGLPDYRNTARLLVDLINEGPIVEAGDEASTIERAAITTVKGRRAGDLVTIEGHAPICSPGNLFRDLVAAAVDRMMWSADGASIEITLP